jgi:hypothetical protein
MPKPALLRAKIITLLGWAADSVPGQFSIPTGSTPELGQFTLPNGSIEPGCLVINDPSIAPPTNWQVKGTIVLIYRTVDRSPMATFQGVADAYQWRIELLQYDRSRSLDQAIELFMSAFQRIKIRSHFRQEDDSYEQCVILLPDQQLIRITN